MSLLNNPEQTYFDDNGQVLSNGWIYSYVPGTTNPKAVYLDQAQTIAASNPVQISPEGRVALFGTGDFRFIVQDVNHVQIYDAVTSSSLASDTISDALLPFNQSPSTTIARQRLGVDQAIDDAVKHVNLITGPASKVTGPTGPTGPTGAAGGLAPSAIDVQVYTSSGTWTKPANGALCFISIWGAGGASASTYGGGGGGGFVSLLCLASEFPASMPITIGQGGIFVGGSAFGANGSDTTIGTFLTMKGGGGGWFDPTSGAPAQGPSGCLSAVNCTVLAGSFDYGLTAPTTDNYGNNYTVEPFSGTAGIINSIGTPAAPLTSLLGGQGGVVGANGGYPGGGGGANGGSGGAAKVLITTF